MSKYRSIPIKIIIIYTVLSFFWILFSDKLAAYFFPETTVLTKVSTYKGWFYVAVVAIILYLLLKKWMTKFEQTDKKLADSYAELETTHQKLQKSNEEICATNEKLMDNYRELKAYTEYIRSSEIKLKKSQEIAHFGNWEMELPSDLLWASQGAFNIYGLKSESPYIELKKILSMIHPDDRQMVREALDRFIGGSNDYKVEYRMFRENDGQERTIYSIGERDDKGDGSPKKLIGVMRDITEEKIAELKLKESHEKLTEINEELIASEEELQQQFDELQENKSRLQASEEKYRTLVENSQDAICSCTPDGEITAANKKYGDFFAIDTDELIGRNIKEFIVSLDSEETMESLLEDAVRSGITVSARYRMNNPDNTISHYNAVISPFYDNKGGVAGVIVDSHDVTEIVRNEEIIRHMAYYDQLTDIPNRLLFVDRLNIALSHGRRSNTGVAVAFLDIDDFKKINDTLGHFAGDELIKAVSKRLEHNTRSNETAARFSGDEFTILIQGVTNNDEVLNFVERVFNIFSEKFVINEKEIEINISMGISIFPKDGHTAEELLRHSDDAMYLAKQKGKNTYQLYG